MPPVEPRLAACLAPLATTLVERDEAGLALKDAVRGTWLHADARIAAWLQRDPVSLVGCTDGDLFGGEAATALRAADTAAAAQATPHASEHKLELAGTRYEFDVLRQRVDGPDGAPLIALVWRDLGPQRRRESQQRKALEQLEEQQLANEQLRKELQGQSPRDSTTGLYNHAHFEDQLRREVDLSTREHREFALVAIEIDTSAEDAVAQARVHETLGRLLRNNTRAMDASSRVGPERFAVLLSGVGLATAHSRMEGLRRQCATQIVAHEGRELGFTVSMGVASFPHTAHTQDELSAACHAALAEARTRGGNRVALASIRFGEG